MVNICSPTSYKGEGQTRGFWSSASLPTPQLTCKEDSATLDGVLVVCRDGAALCCHFRVEEPFKTQPVSERI